MTATKGQGIKSWLKELSESTKSDSADSRLMQALLFKMGYARAKVVSGVVYLEGRGTLESPPQSINKIAKTIYEAVKDVK